MPLVGGGGVDAFLRLGEPPPAKDPSCEQVLEVSPMSASPHRAVGGEKPQTPHSCGALPSQVSLVYSRLPVPNPH